MKFYDCPTAPSPRRVRMFIKEKKLEIETVNLDLRKSEQMEKWFSDINPRNTVPTFVTGKGNILFHSLSIFATNGECRAKALPFLRRS